MCFSHIWRHATPLSALQGRSFLAKASPPQHWGPELPSWGTFEDMEMGASAMQVWRADSWRTRVPLLCLIATWDCKTDITLPGFACAGKWQVQQLPVLTSIYILIITTEKITQKQQDCFMFKAGFEYEVGEQYFGDICKKGKNLPDDPGKGQPRVREIPVHLHSLSSLLPSPQISPWLKCSLETGRTSDLRLIWAVAFLSMIVFG